MSVINPLLLQKKWRFIDHSSLGLHFSAIQSFAYDDTFCWAVGKSESPPVIRTWVHAPTIVLGIQDTRLPFIQQGLDFLKQHGYQYIVRNSGGLAVVLDEGILNISLILPEGKGIDINRGYETMWQLIQFMYADRTDSIEAKEIVGSYCPGSFDLSINNKKFAGISQRRLRNGVAVQIYLCVAGSGTKRANLIKQFYQLALQNKKTKFTYPSIVPSTMASLSELLKKELTIKDTITQLLKVLQQLGATLTTTVLTEKEQEQFHFNLNRICKRNEKEW